MSELMPYLVTFNSSLMANPGLWRSREQFIRALTPMVSHFNVPELSEAFMSPL